MEPSLRFFGWVKRTPLPGKRELQRQSGWLLSLSASFFGTSPEERMSWFCDFRGFCRPVNDPSLFEREELFESVQVRESSASENLSFPKLLEVGG